MEEKEEHVNVNNSAKEELKKELIRLAVKLSVSAVVLVILLFVVFGIAVVSFNRSGDFTNNVHTGDILIYYRFNKNCMPGNIVVYKDANNKKCIGCVAAIGNNICSYDADTKELKVNNNLVAYVEEANEEFTISPDSYLILSGDVCDKDNPLTCSIVKKSCISGVTFSLVRKNLFK